MTTNKHGIYAPRNTGRYRNNGKRRNIENPAQSSYDRERLHKACTDIGFDMDFYEAFSEIIHSEHPIGIDTPCLTIHGPPIDGITRSKRFFMAAVNGKKYNAFDSDVSRFKQFVDDFLGEITHTTAYIPDCIRGEAFRYYIPLSRENIRYRSEEVKRTASNAMKAIRLSRVKTPINPEFEGKLISLNDFSEDGTGSNDRKLMAIALGAVYEYETSAILTLDAKLRAQACEEGPKVAEKYGFGCTSREIVNTTSPHFSLVIFQRVDEE